jgi:predicted dehydrogenase
VGQKKILKRRGCDAYDAIQATVTFEDCFVTFETCWILPKSWPNLIDYQCNLVGSKSTAQVAATEQSLRLSTPKSYQTPVTVGLVNAHGRLVGFVPMPIWHFVDSVLAGKQPDVTVDDGVASTQIIEAALRSIEEGRVVEIDEI